MEEISTNKNEYKANGYFVQPGICYFRSLGARIKIIASFGYYYGFEKGYHLPDKKDQILFNSETEKPINPQWDGMRLGLTVYWCFLTSSK